MRNIQLGLISVGVGLCGVYTKDGDAVRNGPWLAILQCTAVNTPSKLLRICFRTFVQIKQLWRGQLGVYM